MGTISQREEQVMLVIWTLKDNAYLVAIKQALSDIFKKRWTVGAVHKPLHSLEQKGYLESYLGEATAMRGGRAKKLYRITKPGYEALTETKRIHEALWAGFPGLDVGR